MSEEVQLDFQNQMFVELLAEDGLVVLARYMGVYVAVVINVT